MRFRVRFYRMWWASLVGVLLGVAFIVALRFALKWHAEHIGVPLQDSCRCVCP